MKGSFSEKEKLVVKRMFEIIFLEFIENFVT